MSDKSWPGFIDFVNKQSRAMGSVLEHGHPIKLTMYDLVVGYEPGSFHLNFWQEETAKKLIDAYAIMYFPDCLEFKAVALET